MDYQRFKTALTARLQNCLHQGTCVLVFTGKYSSEYYPFSTVDELRQIALYVLWLRYRGGMYFDTEPEEPKKPSIPLEDAELHDETTAAFIRKSWLEYKNQMFVFKNDIEINKHAIKALKERDGLIAFGVLESRSSYEYERMSIEYASEVNLTDFSLLDGPFDNEGYLL